MKQVDQKWNKYSLHTNSNSNLFPFFVLLCVLFSSCNHVHFYVDQNEPKWFSNSISGSALVADSLLLLSFNIQYSKEIGLAIEDLKDIRFNDYSTVLFLQEMDEKGVEKIANEFGLNYLYYPISHHSQTDQNFGNALLSNLPLQDSRKLILPHELPGTKRRRMATSAVIEVGGKRLLLYSVHLHTVQMRLSKRLDQVDAIVSDLKMLRPTVDAIVVGGDFNSLRKKDRRAMVARFVDEDMNWQTADLAFTATALGGLLKPAIDHFFTSGLESGFVDNIEESKASDHLPIILRTRLAK